MEQINYLEDHLFKYLFRNNKEAISILVSGIIDIPYEEAMKGVFIVNELNKSNKDNKKKITDLIYKVDNIYINIEMNQYWYKGLMKRNLDYMKEIILNYNKENNNNRYIQININNFDKYGHKVKNIYKLRNEKLEIHEYSEEIIHINLEKVREIKYTNSELIKLLKIMITKDIKTQEEIVKGSRRLKKVIERMKDYIKITPGVHDFKDYYAYELSVEREKGTKAGIKTGINQNKELTARNMLKKNMSLDDIVDVTGLSKEKILKLKS